MIQNNIVIISIFIFIMLFASIHTTKPLCFYKNDGSLRQFGIGYKNKTIFPLWLLSIVLGISCYIGMNYYLQFRTRY